MKDNETGEQLIRELTGVAAPEMDVENRILKRVVYATNGLAADGWIIDVAGLDLTRFESTRSVTAGHDRKDFAAPVVARALTLERSADEAFTPVQFADTQMGREYAYLYGINPKKEVFMRSWSVDGRILEKGAISFAQARTISGRNWDDGIAESLRLGGATAVRVARRFLVKNFAAVSAGSDKNALTRAYAEGVLVAGELAARLDADELRTELGVVRQEIAALRDSTEKEFLKRELEGLQKQVQALVRDGSAAAGRGDSVELLEGLRQLAQIALCAQPD